jgi:hypothetical protein
MFNEPEMEYQTPHAISCTRTQQLQKLGTAYFCPECKRRIGFLPREQVEQEIINSLINDITEKI